MKARTLPFILVLMLAPHHAGAASVLLNGSFESLTGSLPDSWTSTGNLATSPSQGTSDGTYAIAFSIGNVPSTGVLSQTFNTSAGLTYTITFDFGKYSVNQPDQVARLQVDVFNDAGFSGSVLLNQLVTDSTPGPGTSSADASVYDPYQFNFTAATGTTTIRFSDLSDAQVPGGGFDAMLDNVAIEAVPEPGTSFLFSLLALSAWRRRR
jgi:hypothetical protein